jgi:hypothetical protein
MSYTPTFQEGDLMSAVNLVSKLSMFDEHWLWQEWALMLPILSPNGGLALPYPPALQPTTVKTSVLKMC